MAGQPGPVFDNALRWMASDDVASVMAWLGEEPDPVMVRLSEALPGVAHTADLLVHLGPSRFVQVEFERTGTWDVVGRMVEYRGRIVRVHPEVALTQHVVVLGTGLVRDEVTDADRFRTTLRVTYLRRQPPERLLEEPALAPLAVLAGSGDRSHREQLLRRALRVIREQEPRVDRRDKLTEIAAVLAAIHLDLPTIESAGRESGMPITLEGTQVARAIAEAAEARGLEKGLEQGLEQGLERGLEKGLERGLEQGARAERVRFAQALLRERFGGAAEAGRIEGLAERLAERDVAATLALVRGASTLDGLDRQL